MTHNNPDDDSTARRTTESTESPSTAGIASASRRDFLKAAAAGGAIATGFGGGLVGSAAADVIPTPPLHVDGNLIKDPDGATVNLRGVNMADPKRINVTAPARGKTATDVVDLLTNTDDDWHSRVIRIPVQPVDIGEHEPGEGPPPVAFDEGQLETYLEEHLDPVIERCLQRGAYAIIDYHRHRDVQWNDETLGEEVEMFWDTVAPRYADQPHVMYELYNEPTEPGMWGDPTQSQNWADVWRDWKATAQPWVDTIREHAPDNLILIGSPSWSQSPEGALVEPFDGENLAYTFHIYPGHNSSQDNDWEDATNNGEGVAGVYEEYPLFVTEWGWEENGGQYIGGTTSGYGEPFLEFLEKSDAIHWTAWCADPVWRPVMFDRAFTEESFEDNIGNPYAEDVPEDCADLPCDWTLLGGDSYMGETVKNALIDYQDANPPTVPYDEQPPTTPSNLTAENVTETTVELSWDGSTDQGEAGLSHYTVTVDGQKITQVPEATTATTVEGLESDTTVTIGVSAVDRARNESETVTVEVTTDAFEDSTPPSVPANLTSPENTWNSVTISWDDSTDEGDAETAGLDGYNVYVDGELEREVAAETTQVQIGSLDSDTTYEFGVSAVDRADNESDIATIDVTTDLARAGPNDLLINDYDGDPAWPDSNDLGNWVGTGGFESAEVVDGRLEIDYNASGWYGTGVSQDITDYPTLRMKVTGENGGEHRGIELQFAGIDPLLSEVTDGTIGTTESIVSVDLEAAGADLESPGQLTLRFYDAGDSSISIDELWLDSDEPDDDGDSIAPTAPASVESPTQSETAVEIEWSASSDDGGSGLDHYNVYVDGSLDQQVPAGTTTATIEGLDAGSSYEIGVSAVDGAGNESSQTTVTVSTAGGDDEQAPSAPANLTSTDRTATSVDLAWDDSTDEGGSGLDHYTVAVDSEQVQQVDAGTTTATVSELSPGTSYDIAVTAVDAAGNESTPATLTVATTDGDDEQAPTMPGNLSVTGSTAASIAVSWDASTDNGGSGLDHYAVFLDGSQDQQIEAGTTEATVTGLDPATTYEIGVSAVDGAGNESETTTVEATTDEGGEEPPEDALVVNDYDGDPAWANHRNDLGNWCGAGSFENGGGDVEDGALVLEYDNAGWFVEQVQQDVSEYSSIVFSIAGESGGEGDHFVVGVGGNRSTFSDVADGSIGTSVADVAIDMEAAGIDAGSLGELRLNFWQAGSGSGTLRIEEIRLE
ncbi:Cellulase, glycosyl hydrolase family 5 [Halorhabdus sp. SVX81]|uniref:fibronectin type III domain-containing protein n=1 Tax=Halorhabdus sp. SVX81 TaxID=2978283 RepID=UPI0023DAB7DC|nr:fibronectin type III domain-containing protein [Halorhabdus sp. SVX81]WEL18319.1 Cellulase, glycosyl hydrolase family 5 [Halorhabdus sp. SVX81]